MIDIVSLQSKFLSGAFEQNTYVVSNKNNEAVIIDAGAEVEDIKKAVLGKKVLAVLLTHIHFDHVWHLKEILEEFDCKVYISNGAESKFCDNELNGSILIRKSLKYHIPKDRILHYGDGFGENLKLGSFEFSVYHTAGHSKDSVCLSIQDKLFTGDTIFADGIGRTDLIDSSISEMIRSLNIIKLIAFKTAYPGHYESCSKDKVIETIDMMI